MPILRGTHGLQRIPKPLIGKFSVRGNPATCQQHPTNIATNLLPVAHRSTKKRLTAFCCKSLCSKEYQRRDSNPHVRNGHWILNPARLPFRHSGAPSRRLSLMSRQPNRKGVRADKFTCLEQTPDDRGRFGEMQRSCRFISRRNSSPDDDMAAVGPGVRQSDPLSVALRQRRRASNDAMSAIDVVARNSASLPR